MSDFEFGGFEPSNTTPVPDVFFDHLLARLSGAEIKVLLYIIRRTRGFKKDTDAISLTQFEKGIITKDGKVLDEGCGLNRETICKALASLEEKGCIKAQKRSKEKEKDITIYSIRFKGEVVGKSAHVEGSRKSELPLVGKSAHPSRKNSTGVVGKSDLQETVIQETVIQETERENVVSATQNNALIFHPLHNFIALDDAITPKIITVFLTSKEFESEMEDKSRAFVAQEVKYELEQRGHEVTYKWERTKESTVVDAGIVPPSSASTENDSQPSLFPETPIPIVSDAEKPAPKARKSKKVLDLVPTLPPAKPLEDAPWSVEKCLAWGDYARKCVFPVSNHPQSKYYKSVEAAKKIIGQGITENTFLAVYLNWMKGVNTNLEALPEGATRSETWLNYSVDLWVFIEHYEDEARKYRAKKSGQSFQASNTTPIDFTAQKEAARIKNLANMAKMDRIKAKLEAEKQQVGKKKVAL